MLAFRAVSGGTLRRSAAFFKPEASSLSAPAYPSTLPEESCALDVTIFIPAIAIQDNRGPTLSRPSCIDELRPNDPASAPPACDTVASELQKGWVCGLVPGELRLVVSVVGCSPSRASARHSNVALVLFIAESPERREVGYRVVLDGDGANSRRHNVGNLGDRMDRSDRSPPSCLDSEQAELPRLSSVETAAIARALGNPIRLEILELFHVDCPRTVGDIVAALPLAQSTVSTHLGVLREAGVVRTLRSDARAWHCLNRSMLAAFAGAVTALARRSHRPPEHQDVAVQPGPNASSTLDPTSSEGMIVANGAASGGRM